LRPWRLKYNRKERQEPRRKHLVELQQSVFEIASRIDPPVALVDSEEFASYKEAFRREREVKRWSRAKKEALIKGDLDGLKKLARRGKP
jgi:predicted GIY-YIG superfamily endonuclease